MQNPKKCFCYKFVSPGRKGVPDRMVITPTGQVGFIELKRKGEKPSALQQREISRMVRMQTPAIWCDNLEDAIIFIDDLIKLP